MWAKLSMQLNKNEYSSKIIYPHSLLIRQQKHNITKSGLQMRIGSSQLVTLPSTATKQMFDCARQLLHIRTESRSQWETVLQSLQIHYYCKSSGSEVASMGHTAFCRNNRCSLHNVFKSNLSHCTMGKAHIFLMLEISNTHKRISTLSIIWYSVS